MLRRVPFLAVLLIVLVSAFGAVAAAQEVIYISEPTLTDTPKMLPRSDASLWNMDFKCNPALLRLDCPYEFIYDNYYIGGYHDKDTADRIGVVPVAAAGTYTLSSVDSEYVLNVAGTDVGFAMKLNNRANLAFILNYRYGNVLGDGHFTTNWVDGTNYGNMSGTLDQRLDSHTVAPSVLFSFKVSDAFAIGASLKYAYIGEHFDDNIEGDGPTAIGAPLLETLLIDRDLCLNYHYISPKVGISYVPSDRFVLNASVAAGFYFGGVDKKASLSDDYYGATYTPRPYTEDLHSTDVRGWDIAAKMRAELRHPGGTMTIPLVLDFWYKDFRWGVDGTSAGYFTPVTYSGIFQGPGPIDYENETTTWDITAGMGVRHKFDIGTATTMLTYTHWDFNNDYDQENLDTSTLPSAGLTVFYQDDHETRDIMSLAFTFERPLSDRFSADFGVRYDLGWACRQYDLYYDSPYEESVTPLVITTDGRDVYQDLTLSNHLTFAPTERFKVVLGGFITIPLDALDYDLKGSSLGFSSESQRPWYTDGPAVRDYENRGLEWGGLLSLTYEFGCPVVVPPVVPEPIIEPKLEPMSMK